jgi:hypothetical protein
VQVATRGLSQLGWVQLAEGGEVADRASTIDQDGSVPNDSSIMYPPTPDREPRAAAVRRSKRSITPPWQTPLTGEAASARSRRRRAYFHGTDWTRPDQLPSCRRDQ